MIEALQKLLPWAVSLPFAPKLAFSGLIIFMAILALALLWSPPKELIPPGEANIEKSPTQTGGENVSKKPIESGSGSSYRTVFDSSAGVDGFAVEGKPAYVWTGEWPNSQKVGNEGEGKLSYEPGGLLSLERSNKEGRYLLLFKQYSNGDQLQNFLPKDILATGKRGINITCNAKSIGGEHTLRFTLKTKEGRQLAEDEHKVTENQWTPINVFLEAPHSEEIQVRLYDEQLNAAPSIIQIKDILIRVRNI